MKIASLSLTARLRLFVLKGLARLLARAIAPTLRPAPATAERHTSPRGRIIDGEFRRLDERSASTRW